MTSTEEDRIPDPRSLNENICGVTFTGGTGIEWICIKLVHGTTYKRKSTDRNHTGYVSGTGAHPNRGLIGYASPDDVHYFVNRWPRRINNEEDLH